MTSSLPSIDYCEGIILRETRSVVSRFIDFRIHRTRCSKFYQQYSSNKYIFISTCYSQFLIIITCLFCATAFNICFVCIIVAFSFPAFVSQPMNNLRRLKKQPRSFVLENKIDSFCLSRLLY